MSLERPLPPHLTVDQGLTAYLAENGFDRAAYDARWTPASFLGIPVPVLNTERHRFGIMRHDLHHVATGYGTDLAGEAEISAWEARRGFGAIGLYVSSIVGSLTLFGLAVWPRRVLRALSASGGTHPNLFLDRVPYEVVLGWTIGELRAYLGIPPEGLAGARRLHDRAPDIRHGTPAAPAG